MSVPASVALLPSGPGVYRFRDRSGKVLYIGRAWELRRRVRSYWGDLRDRRHLAPMVRRIARVEALACSSAHEAAWLERNLLQHRTPRWNLADSGGAESEVFLRLDTRPESPGLTLVYKVPPATATSAPTPHSAGSLHYFGPYLGGRKTKLTIAAVHRLLPLPYTGTKLSGSESAMAQKRRVSQSDRMAFVRKAIAALQRDPSTTAKLVAELTHLRTKAVAELRFELAGQIQQELEAFEWAVSEQRATTQITSPAADLDFHGWSSGFLVRYQVRSGRLCDWSVTRRAEVGCRELLAATPPEWRSFAAANAELTALLRSGTEQPFGTSHSA